MIKNVKAWQRQHSEIAGNTFGRVNDPEENYSLHRPFNCILVVDKTKLAAA